MLKILLSFSFIVLISYFKPQNLQSSEFSISEIDDNIFVHFGIQEDSNKNNFVKSSLSWTFREKLRHLNKNAKQNFANLCEPKTPARGPYNK